MRKLSVIILNWNGRKIMEEFLPSVAAFTMGSEVELIVADNGSTDDSIEWLKENYPEIRLIKLDSNYGFAEGYNKAIARVDTPYVLLLNSDVEVEEGWWQPLLSFMEDHPEAGAVQPKILAYKNKGTFEYAGAAGGLLDRLGYPYCRGRVFGDVEEDRGQYDGAAAEISWASGAAMLVRKKAFDEAGGLDAEFFAHMEEIDLCCRMLVAGYRVCALPDSEVFHVGGASLNKDNPKKTYLNFRNNLLLLYKNLPVKKRGKLIFWRQLVDSLAFFMFLLKFDTANAKAVIKAHNDYRKMKHLYPESSTPDNFKFPGTHRKIIFERYILNKRK